MESEPESELRDKFHENENWWGTWRTRSRNKHTSRRSSDSGYGEGNDWEEEEKSGALRKREGSAASSFGSVFSTGSQDGTEEVFEELTPTPDHRDKDMLSNTRKLSANICTEPCWYCKEDIDIRGGILAIKGRPCHPTCIICHYCKTQVESSPGQCLVDDNMTVTCEKCHESVCPVCKEICSEDDTGLVRESSVGKVYHLGCLLCSQCGKRFSEDDAPKLNNDGSYRHEGCDTPEPTRRNSKHHFYDREFANEVPEKATSLTDYEVQMLRSHNEIRERHGVNPVLWSKKLAARARRWAIRLTVLNKSYPATSIYIAAQKDAPFGQNIGVVFNRKSAGSIVKQSVKTWYDGAAKVYDFSNGNPDQELCGFTQMIWDKTTRIGGCLTWFGNIGFVVMNYWPPGNIRGQFLRNVFPLVLPEKENGLETIVLDKGNFMKFVDVDQNVAAAGAEKEEKKEDVDREESPVKSEKGHSDIPEEVVESAPETTAENDNEYVTDVDGHHVVDNAETPDSTQEAKVQVEPENFSASDLDATTTNWTDNDEDNVAVEPEKRVVEDVLDSGNSLSENGASQESEPVSNEHPEDEYEVMRPSVTDQQEDEYEVMRPSVTDQQEDEYEVMRPSVTDQQEDEYEVMKPSVTDHQEDEYEVMRPSVTDHQEDEYEVMKPSVTDQQEDEYEVMKPSVTDQQEEEYEVMRPSVSLSEKQNDSPFSPQILEEGDVFSPEKNDYEDEPIYMELHPEDDYMEIEPTDDYEYMKPAGKPVYENGQASKNMYENTNKYNHDYFNMQRVDDYDYNNDHDYETLSKFRKSKEEPIYDLPTPITIEGGLSGAIFLYSQPPGFEGNVSEESIGDEGDYERGAVLEELVTEGISSDDEGVSVKVDMEEVEDVQSAIPVVEEVFAVGDRNKAVIDAPGVANENSELGEPDTDSVLEFDKDVPLDVVASDSNAESESKPVTEPIDESTLDVHKTVVSEGSLGVVTEVPAKLEQDSVSLSAAQKSTSDDTTGSEHVAGSDVEHVAESSIEVQAMMASDVESTIDAATLAERSTNDDAINSKPSPDPVAVADAAAELVSVSLTNVVTELSPEPTRKTEVDFSGDSNTGVEIDITQINGP